MRTAISLIGLYALLVAAYVAWRLWWTRTRVPPVSRTAPSDPWQRYLDRRRPVPLRQEWN